MQSLGSWYFAAKLVSGTLCKVTILKLRRFFQLKFKISMLPYTILLYKILIHYSRKSFLAATSHSSALQPWTWFHFDSNGSCNRSKLWPIWDWIAITREACPNVGHPAKISSFTKCKFLQVKNSFATAPDPIWSSIQVHNTVYISVILSSGSGSADPFRDIHT